MSFFWSNVFPALIAGGLAGQLVSVFGGSILTQQREHKKWLVSERHKLFSELLTILTKVPKTKTGKGNWTYQIRDVSQKLHILYKGGTAPKELSDSIEKLFQFAKSLKDDIKPAPNWSEEQRAEMRNLRVSISKYLNTN